MRRMRTEAVPGSLDSLTVITKGESSSLQGLSRLAAFTGHALELRPFVTSTIR